MSVQAFYTIANHFRSRYLHPLQFRDRPAPKAGTGSAAKPVKSKTPGTQNSSAASPLAGAREEIQRVGEDHRSSLDGWHAQHSGAASDLLHTFNARMGDIQAQTRPSGGAWEDFHNAFNRPSSAPAQSAPAGGSGTHTFYNQNEDHGWTNQVGAYKPSGKVTPDGPLRKAAPQTPPPAAKPQRVVQAGFFPKSEVRAPQQFGIAATEGPSRKPAPSTPVAPKKRRATQMGLFPKSAVQPEK